ncbi:MAG TPA: protoporphyrinogen oxidase [Thermoanaerobaculia bacterium]|nr:protoporphyrinogen oxidase [Thermoanaerobaculia bacterium]
MTQTVVVGAGLSGLVAGLALARRGDNVRVLEASPRAGGAVRTESADGFLLELGPNTVRPNPELWGLVRELGLAESALFAPSRLPRFIDSGGRLHALAPGPGTLLTTRLLSARGKLRLLREPFVPRGSDAEETVTSFFTRRLGGEVAERLVAPFVSGIWAGDAGELSAAAAFPALAAWERERGSLLRGGLASRRRSRPAEPLPKRLLSFPDGLESLPRALVARLGSSLSLGVPVTRIARGATGWRLETGAGSLEADVVVIATSAPAASQLLAPVDPDAARALGDIPSPPLTVLHLAYPASAFPAPLSGFGHLVVPEPGRRILGAVWSSCLFPGRAPEGQVLLTAFTGGARDPSAAGFADTELLGVATRELAQSLGASGIPRLLRVTRHARAIPQYTRGHAGRVQALAHAERRLAGIHFLGNYRGGISIGDVVRNALAPLS